ncbi:MAG: RNA polymerase sigma factor RpoH [Gammaproteobacteria bacterium]|nr:RNA polymerase sigma factor RpoH [Gammaproteobacteria bacterium]
MTINPLQLRVASLPIGSLDAYIHRVNGFPLLTAQEEHDLATRFRQHEDLDAAGQLVTSHLRFVVKVAQGYLGYGLSLADLIQEGNVGLMKAVKRFDPTIGVRLVSFAIHWIKAEIHEFILKNWRIVKIATTKAQRKLFFNLRKMKSRLNWLNKKEVNEMAQTLNVEPKMVLEMEKRLHDSDAAFDGSLTEDDESSFAPKEYLKDYSFNPEDQVTKMDWQEVNKERLYGAFEQLDDRSKYILQARWLNDQKETLQTLSDKFSISAERVRQIEEKALKRLRALMKAEG